MWGFLCIPDVGAVAGGVCRPIVGGEACGLGVAGCDDATYCPLVNGVTNATCLPKTEAGGECLTSICADGTDCLWSDASQTTALCYTQGADNEACGAGVGLCAEGLECTYDDGTFTAATCHGPEEAGATCGTFGTSNSCVDGYECFINSLEDTTSLCLPANAEGEVCGVGIGLCEPTTECLFDDGTQTSSTCYKKQFLGLPCGAGIGACADDYGLVCFPNDLDRLPPPVCQRLAKARDAKWVKQVVRRDLPVPKLTQLPERESVLPSNGSDF